IVTIGGILINTVIIPNSTIVTINGQEIKTGDFQTRVQMERDRLVNEYNSIQAYAYQIEDATQQQTYLYYLSQIEAQLEPNSLGETVLNQMIDEVFIINEAESRGITVTDEEVDDYYYSLFGYYPNGVPTPTVSEVLPTSTMSPTQLALITPTPGSADDSGAVTTVGEQPQPTSVSQEDFETSREGYLDRMKAYGVDEDYFRNLIRIQLFRDKLNEDLAKGITAPPQEQVWARHILVDDLETANTLLDELNNGGDFGEMAAEYNPDSTSATGGDLGWFGRGQMIPEFEDAAFSGEVGDIVGPVETQYGFHLIQIIGKQEVPADQATIDNLVFTALTDLLNAAKENADIVFADNWINRTPTEPDIIHVASTTGS
ncbi:MAG: peptidylprolyl isomerase, partial [Anaerolineales bacterium]